MLGPDGEVLQHEGSAAEEHAGPHMPWFWQGALQGGGVLNDMMCHSALVVRHLLTEPGASLRTLRPVTRGGQYLDPDAAADAIEAVKNQGKK